MTAIGRVLCHKAFRLCELLNSNSDDRMTKRLKRTANTAILLCYWFLLAHILQLIKHLRQIGSFFPLKFCVFSSSLTEIPARVKEMPLWTISPFFPSNWLDIHGHPLFMATFLLVFSCLLLCVWVPRLWGAAVV